MSDIPGVSLDDLEGPRSPRRVHDLELYAGALALLCKGSASEDELIRRVRAKAREMQRRSSGMGLLPQGVKPTRVLAKSTAQETIRELRDFGLVRIDGDVVSLTPLGREIARRFQTDHSNPVGLRALASLHLARYQGFRALLDALERMPDGLLFLPRPTPTDLGLTVASRDLAAYEPYVAAASEYAATELKAWGTKGVRAASVRAAVFKEASGRDASYRKVGKAWTHRIMIDTIRDALARFGLGLLVSGLRVVDFEIYCSRGSTLGLLNYSDRVDDALGRVVYATSWSDPAFAPTWIAARSLRRVEFRAQGELRVRLLHSPTWSGVQERFARELLTGYQRLNQQKRTLYVLVADLRDIVCYRLRLTDSQFDHLLTRAYTASWEGRGDLRISLDADEIKESRGTQTTKRNPLYLRGSAARTIVNVSRRDQ